MSAQPDSLWLIRVQGKTINTEPLMQCQKTSLEATYWVVMTRSRRWVKWKAVCHQHTVGGGFQMSWWYDPQERWKPKIGLGPALNPEERQCSARCQSILIDQPQPSEPCRLSTNESNWSRYLRYRTPSGVWSRVYMWWSIVSNAALRSSDTRIVGWLESAAVYTWSSIFNSDVSVEWKRR